jgi:hypothetical protein
MEERVRNQSSSKSSKIELREESPDGDYRRSGLLRRLADVLLARQGVQRPTLARQTGLPLQVISDLLAEMESRGLVVVSGRFNGIPGRSNLSYTLAAGAAVAMAAEVSEGRIELVLCDLPGTPVAHATAPIETDGPALGEQIGSVARMACERAGVERFRIGAAHLRFERTADADIAGLEAQLGCAVRLDEDADRAQSERLEQARLDLLGMLFGTAG